MEGHFFLDWDLEMSLRPNFKNQMSAKKKSCLDTDTSRYILIGMQNKCNDGNTSKDLRGKNKKFLHINSFMKLKKKCILFLNN